MLQGNVSFMTWMAGFISSRTIIDAADNLEEATDDLMRKLKIHEERGDQLVAYHEGLAAKACCNASTPRPARSCDGQP